MEEKASFLISVDGGGTKTAFCAYNLLKKEKSYYRTGSTNYKAVGLETTRKNLNLGFLELKKHLNIENDHIAMCVLGLSGCDTDEDYGQFLDLLTDVGLPSSKCVLCNDSELAFYAEGEPPGLVVVGGTGSITFGFDGEGRSCRAGGWGHHVSDLGSGYWMGSQILQNTLLYAEGCLPYEPLYERVKAFYQVKALNQLPEILTHLEVYEIAAVAKVAIDFAEFGDAFSQNLVQQAADHLMVLVKSIYSQLDFFKEDQVEVVLAGGLFQNEYFKNLFKQKLHQEALLFNLKYPVKGAPPVDGGIEIGLRKLAVV